MPHEMKERSLGELIEGAFELYRSYFGVFLRVALYVALPMTLLGSLVSWLMTGHTDAGAALEAIDAKDFADAGASSLEARAAMEQALRGMLAAGLTLPVTMVGNVLHGAVVTFLITDVYLGRPLSVARGFRRAFAQLSPLVGASALAGLGILLGLLCFIIPGLLLIIRWMFTTQAIVVEGNDARASLGRSHELSRGHIGTLMGLFLALAVLGIVVHLVHGALLPEAVDAYPVLRQALGFVPQVLLMPLGAAAITLAYFDARVRNERFDLERLARELGQPDSAA